MPTLVEQVSANAGSGRGPTRIPKTIRLSRKVTGNRAINLSNELVRWRSYATLTKAAGGIHTTPAMAAGVSDHVWKLEEVLRLLAP